MNNSDIQLRDGLQVLENIDALKNTYRQCLIMSGKRNESTAEHTFSLAMAVLLFGRLANREIDLMKTVKMALFHDLAEALLGDVFHYEKKEATEGEVSEDEALLQLLQPIAGSDLQKEIFDLWVEFERGDSAEAVFLRGLDRFLPMYHNFKTKGHSWVKHGITKEMALTKNAHIQDSSQAIWDFTKDMLEKSKQQGWIG